MVKSRPLYDDYAEWYKSFRGDELLPSEVLLADLVEPLQGKRVLDLCCGFGTLTRELSRRGAHAVGVDISEEMLSLARSYGEPVGQLQYIRDDAIELKRFSSGSFDAIVSHLSLMDVDNLAGVYSSVHRVMATDRVFAFSILHPCFHLPVEGSHDWKTGEVLEQPDYLRECRWRTPEGGGVRARVGANHRTVSTYLNSAIAAGFSIQYMDERSTPEISKTGKLLLTVVCRSATRKKGR